MPNRYPERKRIVRDDEDGPVAPPPAIKRQEHANNIPHLSSGIPGVNSAGTGSSGPGTRGYPPQKPFYFGMFP